MGGDDVLGFWLCFEFRFSFVVLRITPEASMCY